MRLSILSDEISRDLDEALRLGTAWGIDTYELRTLDGTLVAPDQKEGFCLIDGSHVPSRPSTPRSPETPSSSTRA